MAKNTNGKKYQWEKIPMANDINGKRYQWQNIPMAKKTQSKIPMANYIETPHHIVDFFVCFTLILIKKLLCYIFMRTPLL